MREASGGLAMKESIFSYFRELSQFQFIWIT